MKEAIDNEKQASQTDLTTLLKEAAKSDDFNQYHLTSENHSIQFSYYTCLIDETKFHEYILPPIQDNINKLEHNKQLTTLIPIEDIMISSKQYEIMEYIMKGYVFIQLNNEKDSGVLVNLKNSKGGQRNFNDAENEYSVVGPKVGFVEDIDINVSLLRGIISSKDLIFEEFTIGSLSKTKVMVAYIKGITNPQHIQTVRQRLLDLDIDVVYDSSFLDQIMTDNSSTPFPLFMSSERVDRAAYNLTIGKVIILSNKSPQAIAGPTSVLDFFNSPEDYYLPWILGSFLRIVRIFGTLLSILATPLYVAVITFHYAVVPKDLLGPIIESRINVPFPPVLEALFLEFTIDLLREAGARLPTKIGQTLGIVGGIVIGQAAVAAALTSNILLIIVSLSALASFTTPIFKMSSTIRILRYPLIIFASIWGGYGIMIVITFMFCHLLRLKSLGTPYFAPLYPFRYEDFSDSFIRTPLSITNKRFKFARPLSSQRFTVKKHKDVVDDFNTE
ncbi:MAG: spore germination protein [Bacillota bacterium]